MMFSKKNNIGITQYKSYEDSVTHPILTFLLKSMAYLFFLAAVLLYVGRVSFF